MINRIFIITIILTATIFKSTAAERTDSTEILFRQGYSNLTYNLGNNRQNLDSIVAKINDINNDSKYKINSLKFIGSASPEGSVSINDRLSRQRVTTLFNYLNKYTNIDNKNTSFEYTGRDWSGLLTMVENDQNIPNRNEVITILKEIIQSVDNGNQQPTMLINQLKSVANGKAYRYMYRNLYPDLRFSRISIDYSSSILQVNDVALTPQLIDFTFDETIPTLILPTEKNKKPFYMALKTNMLYDVLALPTIGAEFYLGKNWSIGASWTYGWWDNDHNHRYWRAYGGDVVLRKWLGSRANEKPLTGHHLGLIAGIVTYDFEFGKTGYMGGLPGRTLWDRCNRFAGIEYGYSLPVGRRLNIDFSLGLGYLGGKVIKYKPATTKGYIWEDTHNFTWIGPIKAEISLVWLIGRGNVNMKGGQK